MSSAVTKLKGIVHDIKKLKSIWVGRKKIWQHICRHKILTTKTNINSIFKLQKSKLVIDNQYKIIQILSCTGLKYDNAHRCKIKGSAYTSK